MRSRPRRLPRNPRADPSQIAGDGLPTRITVVLPATAGKAIGDRPRPLHDWSSHAADAFRYLAMGLREESGERMPKIAYDDRWIV